MIFIDKKIQPKDPILIAAWPGMGHVATNAAMHLKEQLRAKRFAHLKSPSFFYHQDIQISDGVLNLAVAPQGEFFYWENMAGEHDVIIFISEQQPQAEKGILYSHLVLNFVMTLGVKTVFTFAALAAPMDYLQSPRVWAAATQKDFSREFEKFSVKPLRSGYVSGLNGLFLGVAKKRKLKGACLLGEIPFYMSQVENPRASMAVLETLVKFLNIQIDFQELIAADKMIVEEMEMLLDHVRESEWEEESYERPITSEDIEAIKDNLQTYQQIPNSAKRQIEELFSQAKKDISFAYTLKKKLDEWHAYKDYEDRFLALFKEGDSRNLG